jgi:hypothetical protein
VTNDPAAIGLRVMDTPLPASAQLMLDLVGTLTDAAEATIRATAKSLAPRRPRPSRGQTLRPGSKTPLWNEVVTAVRPWLARRGAQAKLARILGVPRQRVNAYFVGRTASPDAERVLLILYWLSARTAGKDPG